MGRETKFGLFVGVLFIILFGIILSDRAGSAMGEHAVLPIGTSGMHDRLVQTEQRSVPGVVPDILPLVLETPVVAPAEERMPAPESLVSHETSPPVAPGAPADDHRGRVAFGPVVIETPAPASGGTRLLDMGTPGSGADTPRPAPAAPARPVHVVRAGDTLTSIARLYYGKEGEGLWKQIWEANKTVLPDANRLAAGQKLVIPGLPAETPKPGPAAPPSGAREALLASGLVIDADAAEAARKVNSDDLGLMVGNQSDLVEHPAARPAEYTVRPGDTFYKIATALYGDASKARLLVLKNKDVVSDPKRLRVGQRILLLEGAQAALAESTVARR